MFSRNARQSTQPLLHVSRRFKFTFRSLFVSGRPWQILIQGSFCNFLEQGCSQEALPMPNYSGTLSVKNMFPDNVYVHRLLHYLDILNVRIGVSSEPEQW